MSVNGFQPCVLSATPITKFHTCCRNATKPQHSKTVKVSRKELSSAQSEGINSVSLAYCFCLRHGFRSPMGALEQITRLAHRRNLIVLAVITLQIFSQISFALGRKTQRTPLSTTGSSAFLYVFIYHT